MTDYTSCDRCGITTIYNREGSSLCLRCEAEALKEVGDRCGSERSERATPSPAAPHTEG